MDAVVEALERVGTDLGEVSALLVGGDPGDEAVARVLRAAGGVLRRAEAVIVQATGVVQERSDSPVRGERLTTRLGCRSVSELVQRTVLCAPATAGRFVRAARMVHQEVEVTTGNRLPGRYPALRQALAEGAVGVDGVLSATAPLQAAVGRISPAEVWRADAELAAAARGLPAPGGVSGDSPGEGVGADLTDADSGPAATAQDLRVLAEAIAAYLDPDGAEPEDEAAMRARGLTLGAATDGLIPVQGRLLPEVAGQLQRVFDALLNPRVAPAQDSAGSFSAVSSQRGRGSSGRSTGDVASDGGIAPADLRTRPQRQHDALATTLGVAARADELPTIGGASPTLVLTMDAQDYAHRRARAAVDGVEIPATFAAARHAACDGAIQRVLLEEGRIVGIHAIDRVFTARQRRAIAARDRTCVVPGCHVPAAWCEIHHVTEHARGGPTHTDNGVLLCWHHHRTLDANGWRIRMRDGLPEIRGPAWWDPTRQWRPAQPRAQLAA